MLGGAFLTKAPGAAWTAPSAPARRKLVVICGQSNAVGTAAPANLTAANAHYGYRYPFPYRANTGNDNDPPTTIDHDWSDIEPKLGTNGLPRFGVELSMSRVLEAAEPQQWAVLKCARSSTSIGNWIGSWPTLDPDGLSIRARLVQQIQAALAAFPYDLHSIIWIQGEADAGAESTATGYGANLLTFVDQLRTELGTFHFVYGRLSSTTPYAYKNELRASQAAVEGERANMLMVDQDGHEMDASDNIHFNHNGAVTLGAVYGNALLAL